MSDHIPYSSVSEQAVLGTLFLKPEECGDEISSSLGPQDFFVPAHRELYAVLKELWTDKLPIDFQSVHQKLVIAGKADRVGSPGILAEIGNAFVSEAHLSGHIRIVKEKSQLRQLQQAARDILSGIEHQLDLPAILLNDAAKTVNAIADNRQDDLIWSAIDLVGSFEAHLGEIHSGTKQAALKTGYECIDRLNGGLKICGMHVFGARPGIGKTAAMMCLTENLCKRGEGVGIISLEMDKHELMSSIYAFMADINSRRFNDRMNDEEWTSIRWASSKIRDWKLWVDDCSLVDVHLMRFKARKMVKNGAGVIMIDYLQLMEAPSDSRKSRNRAEDVAEMSRSIKLLAKELHIPIVIGAQLNRLAADEIPQMHHLRESGSVEQDADVVFLLRQKDPKEIGVRVTTCWHIAKWRGGAGEGNDLDFLFDKTRQRFHEMPPRLS